MTFFSYAKWHSGPERIATIALSDDCTAMVYAEGPFLYEPPGYLSIEVNDRGRTIVPRYQFMGEGSEPALRLRFTVARSSDGLIAALKHGSDVVFMVDLGTGRYWPPEDWYDENLTPELVEELLVRPQVLMLG